MDLRFYDDALRSIRQQTLGDLKRFFFGVSHLAARDRDAILRKNAFGLILVNFHELGISEEEGTLNSSDHMKKTHDFIGR